MSNLAIPTKCLHRLLRNETQHCYDHETTQRRFDAAFDWANDVYPRKKICGLAWIIASEIERSLIGDVNSTFLTVADLRRKHDNDTVMRFFGNIPKSGAGSMMAAGVRQSDSWAA